MELQNFSNLLGEIIGAAAGSAIGGTVGGPIATAVGGRTGAKVGRAVAEWLVNSPSTSSRTSMFEEEDWEDEGIEFDLVARFIFDGVPQSLAFDSDHAYLIERGREHAGVVIENTVGGSGISILCGDFDPHSDVELPDAIELIQFDDNHPFIRLCVDDEWGQPIPVNLHSKRKLLSVIVFSFDGVEQRLEVYEQVVRLIERDRQHWGQALGFIDVGESWAVIRCGEFQEHSEVDLPTEMEFVLRGSDVWKFRGLYNGEWEPWEHAER